jgi:hypothetical protein
VGGLRFGPEAHPASVVTLCREEAPVSAEPGAIGNDMKVLEAPIHSIPGDDRTAEKAAAVISRH